MARSSIGHFARIPLHVARAKVSETAKAVWRELAFMSSPEKPQVWVRQESIAEKIGKSVRTVQRAIKELLQSGLLSFVGWAHGRYKKYALAWRNFVASLGQKCRTTSEESVVPPTTLMSDDLRQECRPIIREAEQSTEQIICSGEETQERHLAWQKRFPCLDGKSGRPLLKDCIAQALNHQSRNKYRDLSLYVETWLQNAASRWTGYYLRSPENPSTPCESLIAWEKRRQAIQERDMAKYFKC